MKVLVDRIDVIREGEVVRMLKGDEMVVLNRLQEILHSEEIDSIPILKGKDTWMIMRVGFAC